MAKTPEQRIALAEKFLQLAEGDEKNRSAQFVLLRQSLDLSTQAHDCQLGMQAIEELDRSFQIDRFGMKADLIRKYAAIAGTTDQHLSVAEEASEVSKDAIAKENFTAAKQFNDFALGEARKAKDDLVVKNMLQRKAKSKRRQRLRISQKGDGDSRGVLRPQRKPGSVGTIVSRRRLGTWEYRCWLSVTIQCGKLGRK